MDSYNPYEFQTAGHSTRSGAPAALFSAGQTLRYEYESFLRELGTKLRKMRVDQGWTLRQMIVEHGFHLAQWQGFEKGKGISVPTLLRLCEIFDLTLEDLIAGLGRHLEDGTRNQDGGTELQKTAKLTSVEPSPARGEPHPRQPPRTP